MADMGHRTIILRGMSGNQWNLQILQTDFLWYEMKTNRMVKKSNDKIKSRFLWWPDNNEKIENNDNK